MCACGADSVVWLGITRRSGIGRRICCSEGGGGMMWGGSEGRGERAGKGRGCGDGARWARA